MKNSETFIRAVIILLGVGSLVGGFFATHQWHITAICGALLITDKYTKNYKKHRAK